MEAFDGSYIGRFLRDLLINESEMGKKIKELENKKNCNHFFIKTSLLDYLCTKKTEYSTLTKVGDNYFRARIINKEMPEQMQKYHEFLKRISEKAFSEAKKSHTSILNMLKILQLISENDLSDLNNLYNDYEEYANNYNEKYSGFEKDGSGAPPQGKASEGRINSEGISYLYLASDTNTAISEVKPVKDCLISVAKFILAKQFNVFDASYPDDWIYKKDEELLDKLALSDVFSRPANGIRGEYWVTQYISEYIQTLGFDGIKFTSSLTGEQNLVLFDTMDYEVDETKVYQVVENGKYEQVLPVPLF